MTLGIALKTVCRFLLAGLLVPPFFTPCSSVSAAPHSPADDFIITVKTDNPGPSGPYGFTIPTYGGGYNYNADCTNDGTDEATGLTGNYTCAYATPGIYTIRISDHSGSGTGFPRVYFNGEYDFLKLLKVEHWGSSKWTSMAYAFYGCSNLTVTASDAPDLSNVTDLSYIFAWDSIFNQPLANWNTSHVTNMASMFYEDAAFNQSLSSWNTSNVTDMSYLFSVSAFNQPIPGWDTSHVTNMAGMFYENSAFNQDIAGWDTSNVTDMSNMFHGASAFNHNIGAWHTSKVMDMRMMFDGAAAFNQPIGSWDTSNVMDMTATFMGAGTFNQNLGNWKVSNMTSALSMFSGVQLSTSNYDALLKGWDAQPLQSGVIFDGGNSTYCTGAAARDHMSNVDGWTITDAGENCSTTCFLPIILRN